VYRGRKSNAKILTENGFSRDAPAAPEHYRMTKEEKAVWNETMKGCPPGFIAPPMYPVLVQYCRLTARAKTLGEWAEGFRRNGDLKQYKSATRSEVAVSRLVKALASALALNRETRPGRKAILKAEREQGKRTMDTFDKPEAWSHSAKSEEQSSAPMTHRSTDVSPWSTTG
jgi:hypothetical protein